MGRKIKNKTYIAPINFTVPSYSLTFILKFSHDPAFQRKRVQIRDKSMAEICPPAILLTL